MYNKEMKNASHTLPDGKSQKGSALFIILIAVALFGALSYAVANMMRDGSGADITKEKSGLYANEILDYGRAVREAVQSMRISNGCSDTDISFQNIVVTTGYTNGANTACQVFNANGGGLNWISPAEKVNDGAEWVFTGTNIADGVGTTAPDLIMILPNITQAICDEINDISGITATGNDATIDFTKFAGTYASTQTLDFAAGKPFGCLNYVNSGDNFFFYQVVLAR